MEDGSKASHTMGGGQQRTHHPRPFFYVQPPSQPYYLPYQQWQMNNPYGHCAMPGGFNFGRPCLNPYQYMQYPGFVFPHAPLYPMDFRRVFEPRFPSQHWESSSSRVHPPHPTHPQEHREMASSEAQTDPSDAITKLIERLDKMQTGDAQRPAQSFDRELDSGVGSSQSSAMLSPTEKKSEQQKVIQNFPRSECCLETPASAFSTTAVYDGDSSHRSLDGWGGGADEDELPLDSSSVQEDHTEALEEQVVPIEMAQNVADIHTDIAGTDDNVPLSSETQTQDNQKSSKANMEEKVETLQEEESCQILKLPFNLGLEAKAVSPLSQSPYYYNYQSMQSTHERMSVLSPSLDELSSRDEMFSTDLEEMELFPRRMYTGKRRLAEVVCEGVDDMDEIWTIGSKHFVCACCGKSLPRGATARSKVHCSKVYLDEGGDSDEEGRYGRSCEQPIRVVVRKHSGPRKTQPLPQRLTKSWYRRGPLPDPSRHQTTDQPNTTDQDSERRDTQEEESQEGKDLITTCQERLCREEPVSEQSQWTEGAVKRRTTTLLQTQELPQRKGLYHRPRDEEDKMPPLSWDHGAVAREPRC